MSWSRPSAQAGLLPINNIFLLFKEKSLSIFSPFSSHSPGLELDFKGLVRETVNHLKGSFDCNSTYINLVSQTSDPPDAAKVARIRMKSARFSSFLATSDPFCGEAEGGVQASVLLKVTPH